jgi:hypothetical protein
VLFEISETPASILGNFLSEHKDEILKGKGLEFMDVLRGGASF